MSEVSLSIPDDLVDQIARRAAALLRLVQRLDQLARRVEQLERGGLTS